MELCLSCGRSLLPDTHATTAGDSGGEHGEQRHTELLAGIVAVVLEL